jgi:hypothetical protein
MRCLRVQVRMVRVLLGAYLPIERQTSVTYQRPGLRGLLQPARCCTKLILDRRGQPVRTSKGGHESRLHAHIWLVHRVGRLCFGYPAQLVTLHRPEYVAVQLKVNFKKLSWDAKCLQVTNMPRSLCDSAIVNRTCKCGDGVCQRTRPRTPTDCITYPEKNVSDSNSCDDATNGMTLTGDICQL